MKKYVDKCSKKGGKQQDMNYKIGVLAIWSIFASILTFPVYADGDDNERLACILLLMATTLSAIHKVMG